MHSILIHKLFSKIYQRIIYYLPELLLPSGTYCYTITISNSKGEVRHLDFLLNRSMPARAFVLLHLHTGKRVLSIKKSTTNISFSSDKSYIHELVSEINTTINKFNSIQIRKGTSLRFDNFSLSGSHSLDQNRLNIMHASYEKWAGKLSYSNNLSSDFNVIREADVPLNRINNLIHLIEGNLISYYHHHMKHISSRLSYTVNSLKMVNGKRWHKYFTLEKKFGNLYMNYATKGKTISSLFYDNDLVHVQSGGLPTPQSHINCGIYADFSGSKDTKISDVNSKCNHNDEFQKLKDWYAKNRLADILGRSVGMDMCPGYIKIGNLLPSPNLPLEATISDFINYYRGFNKVINFKLTKLE